MSGLKVHTFRAWKNVEPILAEYPRNYKSYHINTAILTQHKLEELTNLLDNWITHDGTLETITNIILQTLEAKQ